MFFSSTCDSAAACLNSANVEALNMPLNNYCATAHIEHSFDEFAATLAEAQSGSSIGAGGVLVTARRFKELGATTGEDIEPLEIVDRQARLLDIGETALIPGLLDEEDSEEEETALKIEK